METVLNKNRVAFLDRDGILNVDKGYLYKIEELEWMPNAIMAVKLLCSLNYKVVVVTNQSGIARGYYTVEDMEKLHRYMAQEIAKAGGKISHFYYCPHYKEGIVPEYAVECNCRKPKPGMILQGIGAGAFVEDDLNLFPVQLALLHPLQKIIFIQIIHGFQTLDILEFHHVGEIIHDEDIIPPQLVQTFHNITTDKAGAAGNNNHNFPSCANLAICFTMPVVE